MSPNNPANKQSNAKTEWIAGRKPKYESLRLTVSNGRAFLGARGWSRAHGGGDTVNLELEAIGLQNLAATATKALGELLAQAAAPVTAASPAALAAVVA
ncbi:MAG: hypothetical protein ACYDBQ_11415 [Thermoplasmatota archaeon]